MCRYMRNKKMSNRGFTLLELIITAGIAGIVMSIATIGFNQWLVKGRVEAQIKQMIADFGELRILALTTKQRHSITLNPNSYVFRSYSSEAEPLSGGKLIPGGTHSVTYRLKDKDKADYNGSVYEIDVRGMLTSIPATVFIDYNGSAATDCFTLHTIRVNPGKKNATGDTCNDK